MRSIKAIIRGFIGAESIREGMGLWGLELRSAIRDLRNTIRDQEKRQLLVCVTVVCRTVSDGGGARYTVFGAETFLSPGCSTTLTLIPQRVVGTFTFFVSGHPDLVITEFAIGNESLMSSYSGIKFGVVDGTVEVGNVIRVRVEHRIPGQTL